MSVYILKNRAIAFVKKINALAITDLHIGYEYELRKDGIIIPSQTEKFVEILLKAKEETGAKRLIILGDLKHKVPRSSRKEILDVKKFLDTLSSCFKIIVCKGNHDDRIEEVIEEEKNIEVFGSRGVKIANYGFFHGHAWPFSKLWNAEIWIVGHLQAVIEIRKGEAKTRERVVIKGSPRIKKGKLKTIIILPSFNEILGGSVINRINSLENFLPTKLIDIENSFLYLLDGTEIGKLSNFITT